MERSSEWQIVPYSLTIVPEYLQPISGAASSDANAMGTPGRMGKGYLECVAGQSGTVATFEIRVRTDCFCSFAPRRVRHVAIYHSSGACEASGN